jgi:hypothetical protein
MPFLAWVGLGADGISSAAYGPAEAYLALGDHTYLAIPLAAVTAATVLLIAAAYTRLIEAFPQGGGGYAATAKHLGVNAGLVGGCALLVDYVLTITVSVVAAGDAIFSMLPPEWDQSKLTFEFGLILLGIMLNIRGLRETVLPLVPIFLLFIVTHAVVILAGIVSVAPNLGGTAGEIARDYREGAAALGWWGMLVLVGRAYSLGAGTYTGIEAVANGVNIMREPRVQTARRTMRYMSISLAAVSAGLLLCFLLMSVTHQPGQTLNAGLAERVFHGWPGGSVLVWATLGSEAAILIVAAQTGFIGGPRVLANMALDAFVPRRFAALSERLTTQNGIVLMGGAALAALLITRGSIQMLVIMYSINVFITFSLSMAAMLRATWRERRAGRRKTGGRLALFAVGLVVCTSILAVTTVEKFQGGGWATLACTGALVALCLLIRGHYRDVAQRVARLRRELRLPEREPARGPGPFDPSKPIAAVLVAGYSGLGIHTLLTAMSSFGGYFKNVLFVTVGVMDTGAFKGAGAVDELRAETEQALEQYVQLARRLGLPAEYRYDIGTDPVDELEQLCLSIRKEFPNCFFVAGTILFKQERWFDRLLHNQTALALQRRLHWAGIPTLILPIRVA